MTNLKQIDGPSVAGQFGWERVGREDFAVPVILRSNGVRYCPVRIVEQEIIKKYDALPQPVFQCITLKSFYLTPNEVKLLNNINFNHCDTRYGETFFNGKDVIISADDVKNLSRFLNLSNEIFNADASTSSSYLGVIKLIVDPQDTSQTLLVPYITKNYKDSQQRFVPAKMVEPFVSRSETCVRGQPNDWDIMFLKMLNIYCRGNAQNLITKNGQIVLLEGLVYAKTNSPIKYEDYRNPVPQ